VINTEEALCLSLSLARKLVDARTGVGRRGEVSGVRQGRASRRRCGRSTGPGRSADALTQAKQWKQPKQAARNKS
jgi:hypothetical protein